MSAIQQEGSYEMGQLNCFKLRVLAALYEWCTTPLPFAVRADSLVRILSNVEGRTVKGFNQASTRTAMPSFKSPNLTLANGVLIYGFKCHFSHEKLKSSTFVEVYAELPVRMGYTLGM